MRGRLLVLLAAAAAQQVALRGAEDGLEIRDVPEIDPVALNQRGELFPGPQKVKVTVDVGGWRWLWWPIILYLFWSMAHVCDLHFVRTIEVICERFAIPDDVAGATLMALGCNGPELALNMISIWKPSSIGVGAVVGGEVFNVLVIIGTAVLATPKEYLPLKLSKTSFIRDIVFYVASVLMLYLALRDGEVSRLDALSLLLGGLCYILAVVYLRRLVELMVQPPPGPQEPLIRQSASKNLSDWSDAAGAADPLKGTLLRIRADMRSRLADRNHQFEDRFAFLQDDALVISTVADPSVANESQCDVDMVYDSNEVVENHWHRAGLVGRPMSLEEAQKKQRIKSLPVLAQQGIFEGVPWEVIALKKILFCEPSSHGFFLHVHAMEFANDVTLEVVPFTLQPKATRNSSSSSPAMGHVLQEDATLQNWYKSIREHLKAARRKSSDRPRKKYYSFLMDWVDWLQFPVKSLAGATIPDMDCPETQCYYPVAFLMSMCWLGVLSSMVVTACDGIHRDFGIPTNVLGFTVAAAGTSFPNVFSGMCVARQGKAGMAVANALGANVQNVFLALAIPWTVQAVFMEPSGHFELRIHHFKLAIQEIFITLIPLVMIYFCCGCALPRWSGAFFLLTYVVYLVFALNSER